MPTRNIIEQIYPVPKPTAALTSPRAKIELVVVKPRGSGSEFSVVYVQTSVQD